MKKLFLLTVIMSWSMFSLALGSGISSHLPATDTEVNGIEEEDVYVYADSADYWDDDSVAVEEIYHSPDPGYTQEIYKSKGKEYSLENVIEDFNAERYGKIISDAEAVLEVVPDSHEARYYAAVGYYFSGMKQKAYDYMLKLAVDYPTEDYFKYATRWCTADRDGALHKADILVQKAIDDNYYYQDEINEALWLLVNIAMKTGYLYDALDYIDLMKEDDYFLPYMNKQRAIIYNLMDKPEEALEMLETIPEDLRDDSWIFIKSTYLRNAKGIDASIEYARELLSEDPERFSVYFSLIPDLTLRGDYDEAIRLCTEILELVDDSDD